MCRGRGGKFARGGDKLYFSSTLVNNNSRCQNWELIKRRFQSSYQRFATSDSVINSNEYSYADSFSEGWFTVCVIEINARWARMYFLFAFNVTTAMWNSTYHPFVSFCNSCSSVTLTCHASGSVGLICGLPTAK